MGDMKTIIDKCYDELCAVLGGGFGPIEDVEAALWKLWEASYRDGYQDGQLDAEKEE